jgi:hypothetical protein
VAGKPVCGESLIPLDKSLVQSEAIDLLRTPLTEQSGGLHSKLSSKLGDALMPFDDDETDRIAEKEQPGVDELLSALSRDTLIDVIQQTPLTVEVGATLAEAVVECRPGIAAISRALKEGKLAGIFMERDVLMRVAGQQLDLD